jgi:hypothetical protein
MNTMTVTNVLLLVIAGLLFEHFYPDIAHKLWPLVALFAGFWLIGWLHARWQQMRAERKQKKFDEKLWWEYSAAQTAIRKKYDPENKWNEATSTPQEFHEEMDALNHSYRGMLKRRFGDDWD